MHAWRGKGNSAISFVFICTKFFLFNFGVTASRLKDHFKWAQENIWGVRDHAWVAHVKGKHPPCCTITSAAYPEEVLCNRIYICAKYPVFFYLFMQFIFGSIPGDTHDLLLALCSGFIPGGLRVLYGVLGIEPRMDECKLNALSTV